MPELQILRKTIHSFVKDHISSAEHSAGPYAKELPIEVVKTLKEKARQGGMQALGAKEEWGGAELSLYVRTVLFEEASQHRFGLYDPAAGAFGGDFPAFLEKCSNEQIETYVKPAIQKGKGCFVALWEESEDNHVEKITCSAVRHGDFWKIDGEKAFIQRLDQSSFGVVLVNCLLNDGQKAPTLFILSESDLYQKSESPLIDVQKTYSITFKKVRIHDNRRIGEIGSGGELIKSWLAEEQVLLGARCLGVCVKALEYGKQYAKLRITRGKPLAEFPTIRSMIAEGFLKLQAARLMVHDAAKKIDNQTGDSLLCAQMAKLFAVETASKIIDDVLQIHGGSGFAGDLPIERWYKELRIARVNLQKTETIIENIANSIL